MSASATVEETYRRLSVRRVAVIAAGLLGLIASLVLDVATGPAFLPVVAVAKSVLGLAQDRTVDAIV